MPPAPARTAIEPTGSHQGSPPPSESSTFAETVGGLTAAGPEEAGGAVGVTEAASDAAAVDVGACAAADVPVAVGAPAGFAEASGIVVTDVALGFGLGFGRGLGVGLGVGAGAAAAAPGFRCAVLFCQARPTESPADIVSAVAPLLE
jgi:hypothetical protein